MTSRRPLARTLAFSLLLASVAGAQAPQQPAPLPFDLEEATVADLQQRMASGRETARTLAQKYLARIDAIDRGGPALRSVIETNPDALAIADQLDAERRSGRTRGILHGIPVLLKDNIATADRMMTTAGSLALAGVRPSKDAFIVTKLRDAGAVILGKTNLSEWANFRSTHSTSGWSARGGLTKNPYALDRNTSGSSSGSGVAVAANLAAVAVGTETDGSIVSPSTSNGLVGIKPTLGLLSRSGIVPIAHSQDTAGPMARTVADAAALLGAMAGMDPDDASTRQPARSLDRSARSQDRSALSQDRSAFPPTDYSPFLDANGLRGARIGVVRNKFWGYNTGMDRLVEAAVADMKKQGAVIVDPANIPTIGRFDDTELEVLLYEFKADLNTFLARLGPLAPVRSLEDVIAFNEAHAADEMPYFGQELFVMAEQKGPLTDPKYRAALARNHRLSRTLGIDAVMAKHHLDALVAPTGNPAWLTDLVNGDMFPGGAAAPSTITSVAGYPHITVPAGFVHGLPVGVSFFAGAWSEPMLIKLAFAYEQATKHRRAPTFASTVRVVP